MTTAETLVPLAGPVDHLLLGVADLERGITWIEKMTGVKPIIGGSHPGAGTRNGLISLGSRRYLEIIAPDPHQGVYNFHIDVRTLEEPRLITWAALTDDITSIAEKGRQGGLRVVGPREGSRQRPDGKLLKWKTLRVLNPFGSAAVEPVPFFIQWAADSAHPSHDSPKGCELQSLQLEHPHPAGVSDLLRQLGIKARVEQARDIELVAVLDSPKGLVRLS